MGIVRPRSPVRRLMWTGRCAAVLRGRYAVLRAFCLRRELRRRDDCDSDASVDGTALFWRLVGPLAACLCIVGFWHVYLNIRPSHVLLARLVLILFSILMVGGSAVHTLWTAKGLALKYCYGQGAPCSDLLAAIKSYWALAYNLGAIPGYLGAVLLFALVLLRKTYYPR